MQIQVVERKQQILVQEQEILRKEKELDAKVRRPAEAEKFKSVHNEKTIIIPDWPVELNRNCNFFLVWRLEKLAEAHRQRVILEAEAEAEAIRLNGEAQAFAIEAKAKAEAEQMSKKAAAFKEYREAAMVDMLLNTLPKVSLMERFHFFLRVLLSSEASLTSSVIQFKRFSVDLIFKCFLARRWDSSSFTLACFLVFSPS